METKCELKECQLFFKSGENTLLVSLDKSEHKLSLLIGENYSDIPTKDFDKFIDILAGMVAFEKYKCWLIFLEGAK